jgi:hypothetical protein
MAGILIFVLIILAGIITGISLIPAALIALLIGGAGPAIIMSGLGLVMGIYFLGFVFEKFKVKLNRK